MSKLDKATEAAIKSYWGVRKLSYLKRLEIRDMVAAALEVGC